MTEVKLACVCEERALLGEGSLWDPDRNLVWWIDIRRPTLHAHDVRSGRNTTQQLDFRLTSLGLTDCGDLIACGDPGIVQLAIGPDNDARMVRKLATPDEPAGNRFNDGSVDASGRFWVGTMDDSEQAALGTLYRFDARGMAPIRRGIRVPNGPAILSDDTLLTTDSATGEITALQVDAAGNVLDARPFARFASQLGHPDGMAVDEEDHVWIAFWDGACLRRLDPTGRVVREIELPVRRPTCPVFGGPGLRHLYVTSASIGLDDAGLRDAPWSGGLLRLDPGVKGAPPHRFRTFAPETA